MNTTRLSKHYEALTPWERVPLIQAAALRGDPAERERLARSTPTHAYRLPDYWGLSEGLQRLAKLVLLLQFDLAAPYWQGLALLAEVDQVFPPEEAERQADRLWACLRMLAFRWVRLTDAWQTLGVDLNLDGAALLRHLPGAATMQRFEAEARAVAFTPEEALTFLRSGGGDGDVVPGERPEIHLETADEMAAAFRQYLADHLAEWS